MINVFCAYAHENEPLRQRLEVFLTPLSRRGLLSSLWHDRRIVAGIDWRSEISDKLDTSQLILFLVSPDLMASEYIMGVELKRAIERSETGQARIIPIVLSAADTTETPFDDLQMLPVDAAPVDEWASPDQALRIVSQEIERSIYEYLEIDEVPSEARRAILARYRELKPADSYKRHNQPGSPAGQAQTSDRGTSGYSWLLGHTLICWSATSGAHIIRGAIGDIYRNRHGVKGRLGFPLTDELVAGASPLGTKGKYQRFEGRRDIFDYNGVTFGGSMYYAAGAQRAFPVWGAIGYRFEHLGGTSGVMGFPTSFEEYRSSPQGTTGQCQNFEGGAIFTCKDFDTVPVVNPIFDAYSLLGGAAGQFGFPKGPASTYPEKPSLRIQEFEGGAICAEVENNS